MIDKMNPPTHLIQKVTGRIYPYAASIADRSDMEAYEMPGRGTSPVESPAALLSVINVSLRSEVAALKEEAAELHAELAGLAAEKVAREEEVAALHDKLAALEIDPDELRLRTIVNAVKAIPVENYTKAIADKPPQPRVKDVEEITGFKTDAEEIKEAMNFL